MERPRPTKQIVLDLTGQNQGLLASAQHGLYEVSLSEIYPMLDFKEALAFAASSHKSRQQNISEFRQRVDNSNLYELFSDVFKIGMPWVNKYKSISPINQLKYDKLNPFRGSDLKNRLELVAKPSEDNLRQKLKEEVNEYVFECQYQQRKMARGGDNHRLVIMRFQNVYPKAGRIVPSFAGEVARVVGDYPINYELLSSHLECIPDGWFPSKDSPLEDSE